MSLANQRREEVVASYPAANQHKGGLTIPSALGRNCASSERFIDVPSAYEVPVLHFGESASDLISMGALGVSHSYNNLVM